ncbi:MAG TPA: hypothetical protein VFV71_08830 [Burkholderiales bacterium]|nr:hypothetical protein [Burkholderiales bacterium]
MKKGIAANRDNPALNRDMQQVLSTLAEREAATARQAVDARQASRPAAPKSGRVLSAYRHRTEGKE